MPMWRKVLAVISLLLALTTAALYAASFWRSETAVLLVPLFCLNLLFLFIAILAGRTQGDPPRMIAFPRKMPAWSGALLKITLLFFFLNLAILFMGTPVQEGDHFFKRSASAKRVAITQAEYQKLKGRETRMFASVLLALDVGLGLALWFKK